MATADLVSFVVPVRDDVARLQHCLASIKALRIKGVAIETVVADNGSSDGSPDAACRMGARVLSLPGLSVAQLRNRAAVETAGDLIAFVDADHILDPGWLEAALDAIAEPRAAAAGTACSSPAGATWVQRAYDRMRPPSAERAEVHWLGSGNLLVRRDAFLQNNGFDESLETCEDVDLCQRFRLAGWRVISEPGMRSIHLGDPSTLSALFFGELWRGRDNLRVTLRGPRTPRTLAGLLVSIATLIFMAAAAGTAIFFPILPYAGFSLAVGFGGCAGVAVARAVRMTLKDRRMQSFPANLVVGGTYEMARALALAVRVSYRTRRLHR